MCPGCGQVMLWNLNARPRAGAYSFVHELVRLHMRQTLPKHIALNAFLPAMVLPGVSFRQHDDPVRPKRALAFAIGERAALFPPTFA